VDIFSHDTWKPIADFLSDWRTIATSLAAIVAALGSMRGWFVAPFRWLGSKFRPSTKATEGRPLRFVTNDLQSRWGLATARERQGTHVHGMWHVTNVSDYNVVLLKARIEGHEAEFSHVMTQAPDQDVFGSEYPIPARCMSEVSADFTFFPSIGSGGDAPDRRCDLHR
jgi:hypothetical protein